MAGPINQELNSKEFILSGLEKIQTLVDNDQFLENLVNKKSVKFGVADDGNELTLRVTDEKFKKDLESLKGKPLSEQKQKIRAGLLAQIEKQNVIYKISQGQTKKYHFSNPELLSQYKAAKENKAVNPNKPPVTRTYVTLTAADQTAISESAKKFLQEISGATTAKPTEQPKKEESKPTATRTQTPAPAPQAKTPDAPPEPVSKTIEPKDVDEAVSEGREKALKRAEEDEAHIKAKQKLDDEKSATAESDAIKNTEVKHQELRQEVTKEASTSSETPKT